MKVLLLGSLISQERMEFLNNKSRTKASIAPVNYELMLAKGLYANSVEIEALSVAPVAAFPGSSIYHVDSFCDIISQSINIKGIKYVNVQGIKQFSIRRQIYIELKKWLIENANIKEKAVLMYSIYPPYTEPCLKLSKKYGCHVSAIITDLPELMYTWKKPNGIHGYFAMKMQKKMINLQGQCDSYVLFTKYMANKMCIDNKPYIVSEGLSDVSIYDGMKSNKYPKKTLIYAGNLSRLYGIRQLVNAFIKVEGDYELHFYGYGEDSAYITEKAASDSRIKYYGRVERRTVLQALMDSTIIVINKPSCDEYSKYSFSSKILECMASGTPVLATRVPGMPEDYYPYLCLIEDETIDGLSTSLKQVLNKSEQELSAIGTEAKDFARKNKNYISMCSKIAGFLRTIM